MNPNDVTFNRSAVRPFACFGDGIRLLGGDYFHFVLICFLGSLVGGLAPFFILRGPMECGIFMCYLAKKHKAQASVNLLFRGFDHFVQSLLATLFWAIPLMIVAVPLYIGLLVTMIMTMPAQNQAGPPAGDDLALLFGMMGVFYGGMFLTWFLLSAIFMFMYPLIVDRGMTGGRAAITSLKAAYANLGGVLMVSLMNAILSVLGLMMCYIGIVFVLPITYASCVIAYRQVFPAGDAFDDEDRHEPWLRDREPRPLEGPISDGIQAEPGR